MASGGTWGLGQRERSVGREGLGPHCIGPWAGTLPCLAEGGVWSLQARRGPPTPFQQVQG